MNIKFHSLQQFRNFYVALEQVSWDGRVTIEQRDSNGEIIVANSTKEIKIDSEGMVF